MREMQQSCPHGHGEMILQESIERTIFRGEEITSRSTHFVCPACGFKAATMEQASAMQRQVADIYRQKKGLLTAREIREGRKNLNLTQKELAAAMSVGIASIKRWERGTIQTPSMDRLLRQTFGRSQDTGDYPASHRFSLARTRLVLLELGALYDRDLLARDADFPVNSCLLWYADMTACKELGASLTGAGYAVLPSGPYLNNFEALAPLLQTCDENSALPLSTLEEKIVRRVHQSFPRPSLAQHYARRESAWQERQIGEPIPNVVCQTISLPSPPKQL